MICKNCGNEIGNQAKCVNCGAEASTKGQGTIILRTIFRGLWTVFKYVFYILWNILLSILKFAVWLAKGGPFA